MMFRYEHRLRRILAALSLGGSKRLRAEIPDGSVEIISGGGERIVYEGCSFYRRGGRD